MKNKVYAAIDMGSGTIKLVIGSVFNNEVNIYKVSKIRTSSQGFKNGEIIDMDEVARNIKQAINEMSVELKINLEKVALSIPPIDLKIFKANGYAKVMSEDKTITSKTIQNAIASAKGAIDTITYKIVQNNPSAAYIDKREVDLKNIIGQHGEEVEICFDIYAIPKSIYEKYKYTLKLAGLELSTIATSSTAISNEVVVDKTGASVIIDIGHHKTTVSAFYCGALLKTAMIPIAGKHITHDINSLMKINSYGLATTLKHKHVKLGAKNSTIIHFDDHGNKYDITFLNRIATRRSAQILKEVEKITKQIFLNKEVQFDFVLTGGSAAINNIDKLAKKIFGHSTRIYVPTTIGANTSDLTTAIGMIYLVNKYSINTTYFMQIEGINTKKWFKKEPKLLKTMFAKLKRAKR